MPISTLTQWLDEEKVAGAPDPKQAVLATCTPDAIPHSRVVAIREISPDGLLFFTQKGTRKVAELLVNPHVSLNFWFELTERQIIIEGIATPLTDAENHDYWITYSRFAQLRFYAYAPTSSQEISSKQILEDKKNTIAKKFENQEIPVHPLYCGYRIKPIKFLFYTYRTDELSDITAYLKQDNGSWEEKAVSP